MTEPTFTFDRGIATATWGEPGTPARLEFTFDWLTTERRTGEVKAELVVRNGVPGARPIFRDSLNLTSSRTRSATAKELATIRGGPNWREMLEDVCWRVVDAHRQGRPAILVRDAQAPPDGEDLVALLATKRDPAIIFGDGGVSKSYIGLALAASIHTQRELIAGLPAAAKLRTAFLDFEWNPWPHHKRLRALWGPSELPDLVYIPCQQEGPLVHQVDRLRRKFHEHRIEFVVIDSIAQALSGPATEDETARAYFQALARLEVGSIHLAHIVKDAKKPEQTKYPFGSVFFHNGARLTWYVEKVRASKSSLEVTLHNRKVNDGGLADPIGLRFEFGDRTTITSGPAGREAHDGFSSPRTGDTAVRARMIAVLKEARQPMTYATLGAAIDTSTATVRDKANAYAGRDFVILDPEPGSQAKRVALLAQGRTDV